MRIAVARSFSAIVTHADCAKFQSNDTDGKIGTLRVSETPVLTNVHSVLIPAPGTAIY